MANNQQSQIFHVAERDCISSIDSSLPDILGTYIIVKWMEIVSAKIVNQQLDDQYISVGGKISIDHTGMVKLGDNVEIISTIKNREKRRMFFLVEALSNGKIIANAQHERVIISTKMLTRIYKNKG